MQSPSPGKQERLLLDFDNKESHLVARLPGQIAQFDAKSVNHLGTSIRAYNERIQTQLDSVVREFNGLSKNVLNTLRVHHQAAFHDFMRRTKTGAIPVDPTNFHACLAGSVVMCGSAPANNAGGRRIEAEPVGSNVILERLSRTWIQADHTSIGYSYYCGLSMSMALRTWN